MYYNYDKIFKNDSKRKFFYSDYKGPKLVNGKVNLENAKIRKELDEYYALVAYQEREELPKEYRPLTGLISEDGELFATINLEYAPRMDYICRDSGIQMITRLNDAATGNYRYLLGPGPDTVELLDLVMEQYNGYIEDKSLETTSPVKK